MQLGMVGLGRMGANMTERLRAAGHDLKTFDPNVDSTASSLEELVQQLDAPRSIWLMVPAGLVDSILDELAPYVAKGDTIIDGGNSYYIDDLRRSGALGERGIHYVNVGRHAQETDAETTPLRNPEHYMYELDVAAIAEVWRRGSVISSWLLDLTAQALNDSPNLDDYAGRVSDSGEGRWTVQAAVEEGVPAPVLAASLFDRFASRGEADWGNRVLSAMRHAFGGHLEKSPEQ